MFNLSLNVLRLGSVVMIYSENPEFNNSVLSR